MVKTIRNLSDELAKTPGSDHDPILHQSYCALQQKLSCCDGVGFTSELQGPMLKAKLCSCVASCKNCFGKVRQLVNGVSKPCRSPSPATVVNILNSSGIPSRYGKAQLKGFSNFTGNGREAIQAIAVWLRDFKPREPKGLILGGPVGVGKTYLLAATAKNLAARGLTIKFVDFFQLLSELKSAYSSAQSDLAILKPLLDVDILFIDEMGKGRSSDWEMSVLDQVVMSRYNQNKAIVASTNYGLRPEKKVPLGQKDLTQDSGGFNLDRFESLESRVGQRIFSRLVETCQIMEISGEDFRQQNLQQMKASLPKINRNPNSDRAPF